MSVQIGKDIIAQPSEYKGKWYFSIRKWYEQDGELKPGKGINMTAEDFKELDENWEKIKKEMYAVMDKN